MINAQNLQQTVENTRYIRSQIGVRGRYMETCFYVAYRITIWNSDSEYILAFDKSPSRVELRRSEDLCI